MNNNFYLTEDAIQYIIEKIDANQGGEVFFGLYIEEDGAIVAADAICNGNEEAVLAPYEIAEKYNAILHNHPSSNIQPSPQDLQFAATLRNQGIGFFITNNKASKLNTVVPPILTHKSSKIPNGEIEEIFQINGKINEKKKFRISTRSIRHVIANCTKL